MTPIPPINREAERTTEWIFLFICLGFTFVIARWWFLGADTFEERLGLDRVSLVPAWAWLLAAAVAALYCVYTLVAVPDVRRNAWRWSRLKALGLWAALVSGIVEEVVFRHLLMNSLKEQGWSTAGQIAASAGLFGVAHAIWVLLARDWHMILPVVASTTTLGLLLALLYIAGSRSTLPPIAAHIVVNLVIEPWLILAAITGAWHSSRPKPSPSTPG